MGGDDDKAKGVADKTKGRVKEATGALTGNKNLKEKGRRDQTKGSVKEGLGKVKNKAEDLTS